MLSKFLCLLYKYINLKNIYQSGPKRAIDLIKEHKSIEKIIEKLDTSKYPVPDGWLFKEARQLFIKPDVTDPETIELKWNEPDEEAIVQYMCNEKGFGLVGFIFNLI